MSAENGVVWRLRMRCEYMSGENDPTRHLRAPWEYMSAEADLIAAVMYSQGGLTPQGARDSAPFDRQERSAGRIR